MKLGYISEQFESGGAGPGTISNVSDDPGGKSYGTFQLSKQTLEAYIQESVFKLYATPGYPDFDEEWLDLAGTYPDEFALDQWIFVTLYKYLPVAIHAKELGYETSDRRIQEAIFSIAVQHGKAKQILTDGLVSNVSIVEQVTHLYQTRSAYVESLKLSPRLNQVLQNRYKLELQAVLKVVE